MLTQGSLDSKDDVAAVDLVHDGRDLIEYIVDVRRRLCKKLGGPRAESSLAVCCEQAHRIVFSSDVDAANEFRQLCFDRAEERECKSTFEMAVICLAMERSLGGMRKGWMPAKIVDRIVAEFQQITERIGDDQFESLSCAADPTLRTLRTACLQWIPAGVYYFEYSRIPKRNLVRCPWRDKPALARFLTTRMKGFGPTIEMHLPTQLTTRFTKERSDESHRLVALVLAEQPQVRGISGASWYTDPAVLKISPHLSFVREMFENHRGFVHRLGPATDLKAVLKSQTRRRMYEEGKYVPTVFARYWARDDVIQWAQRNQPT